VQLTRSSYLPKTPAQRQVIRERNICRGLGKRKPVRAFCNPPLPGKRAEQEILDEQAEANGNCPA
jgi:hypothetical protein